MRRVLVSALILLPLAMAGCGQARNRAEAGGPGQPPTATSSSPAADDGIVRTAGCVYATTTPEMFIDGTPQPANQTRLDDVAQKIHPRATGKFAPVFGGIALVQERDRIQVYRKPSAEFDAWILADFRAECVELVDIKFALVELEKLQNRVSDDMTYWRQKGLQINSVGADFIRGAVVVGTGAKDVAKARKELPPRYQDSKIPIVIEEGGPYVPLAGQAVTGT